ncbi:MAG: IMP dehydrogenase [Candidatus Diapherotrites archaeon]
MRGETKLGLTFDDVLLIPMASSVHPHDVDLKTKLTKKIDMNIPLVSAAMDTVTEYKTAIVMAQQGGIGIIHRNMSPEEQAEQVSKVKRSEIWVITNPVTVSPEDTLAKIFELKKLHNFSSFPVVSKGKLVGIVTNRDLRFETNFKKKVNEVMSKDLITVNKEVKMEKAKQIMHEHRIEKLPIVNSKNELKGLITTADIKKSAENPNALKDAKGRLKVGAAIGPGDFDRVKKLIEQDTDVFVIDTAHGHAKSVVQGVRKLKNNFNIQVIAGNAATAEAVHDLISAGADAVKVGVGPGAICTTRVITGAGMPQFTAIQDCAKAAEKSKVPIIADGGLRYSGDIAKAIGAGASSVMIGSIFAGTDETPGRTVYLNNRKFKQYRGMGSISAMTKDEGARDRYFQKETMDVKKLVPEGIEGIVPYKGSLKEMIYQLLGGVQAGMGMVGAHNISEMQKKAKFVRVTNAGLKEGHPHDINITEEAPNYP